MKTTVIYQYGCRVDKDCLKDVDEQFWLAQKLYNKLIEQIRGFRSQGEEILRQKSQDYDLICRQIEDMNKAFKAAKKENDEDRMVEIRATEKKLWADRKPLNKEARKAAREELKVLYSQIGKSADCKTYQLTQEFYRETGLYHETAWMTHDAALKAWQKVSTNGGKLHFRVYSERTTDHIDARIGTGGGADIAIVEAGNHKLVGLSEPGTGKYPGFRIRIGGGKKVDGKTVYPEATGTWNKHRPFPEGAMLTTTRLVRKRIGSDIKWYLQFQLKVDHPTIDTEERLPIAAIHFGWNISDDGLRRIAAISTHEDPGMAEFIDLPYNLMEDFARAEALQSERDKLRDEFKEKILPLFDPQHCTEDQQKEHAAMLKLPTQHLSQKRLVRFNWQIQEVDIHFPELQEYSKKEWRLYQAQRHIEKRARNRRRKMYQQIALDLVKKHSAIIYSVPDLKDAALRIKDDGKRNELGQLARTARSRVALSELKEALNWAAARAGTAVIDAPDFSHTKECAVCGNEVERDWDIVTCNCGHVGDTKANSSARLYQKSQEYYREEADKILKAAEKKAEESIKKQQERLKKMQEKRRQNRKEALEA